MFSLVLLSLMLQLGQQKPPAQTDVKPAVPGIIRGKVVASDTGEPLKHASVSFRSTNGQVAASATTDGGSMFELLNVDPGQYMAFANKTGFINTLYKKGNDYTPVVLTDGQELKNIDFLLPRAGVVSGTVLDEDEEPVPDLNVQALMKSYVQGKMRLQQSASATTDDRGHYRIHDLPAGRYYLRVAQRGRQTRPEGHYGMILYPNATRLADAQVIKVGPGQEVAGMKFTLHESPAVSVAGRITDLRSGQAVAGAMIQVNPEDYVGGGPTMANQSRPDGSFRLTDLTPGRYRLTANSTNPAQSGFTTKLVDVPDHSVDDVMLFIGGGATVKGIVTADGGTLPDRLRIQLMPQSMGNFGPRMGQQPITTEADGSFQIPEVSAGTYDLMVFNMNVVFQNTPNQQPQQQRPAVFFVSSIMAGNQDVTDTGITVPDAATSLELAIKLDFRSGAISGHTLDADNNPLGNAKIALVSADPKKREIDRYYRRGQSDSAGTYKINGVIPGDYLMVIWPGDDPAVVQDPDVIAQLDRYCVAVSVSSSGIASQDLKLIPAVQSIAFSMIQ